MEHLVGLVFGLIFGGLIGFVIAAAWFIREDGHGRPAMTRLGYAIMALLIALACSIN